MNETLKAVILEIASGNVRDHHLDLRGAFGLFPNDCLGGANATAAGRPIELQLGTESLPTDIDAENAIFREHGAIGRFFEQESVVEGDLVMIERLGPRSFALSKVSKRVFKNYL